MDGPLRTTKAEYIQFFGVFKVNNINKPACRFTGSDLTKTVFRFFAISQELFGAKFSLFL